MQIRTQYRAVLVLSVIIQLGLFFIVASGGLWLDQLINGVAAQIATRRVVYKVLTALVLAVSPHPRQRQTIANINSSC